MTTYKDAGVDIEKGDEASKNAYDYAKMTFAMREGMPGAAVKLEGGFSGAHDMGDHYLVHNSDGVGTKVMVAQMMGKYDTLGYDLLAMVCDDSVCMGAETFSITNTIDTEKVEPEVTAELLKGLSQACQEQKIVIAGGEIAELNALVNGFTWNASAIGMVAKDRVITGSEVKAGQKIVGLQSAGPRANGMSLIRKILKDQFGENWANEAYEGKTWGEVVLTPSRIYSACVLDMLGRHGQERKLNLTGVVHITGGGVTNLHRVLKHNGLGANLDKPIAPHDFQLKLQEMGDVADEEAYKSWNMGTGMMLIMDESLTEEAIQIASQHGIHAQVTGEVTGESGIQLKGMTF